MQSLSLSSSVPQASAGHVELPALGIGRLLVLDKAVSGRFGVLGSDHRCPGLAAAATIACG